jgi:putative MFS transporter
MPPCSLTAAEIYPLPVRATGAGLIAAASKLGGIMGAGVGISAVIPELAASAMVTVVPVALSAVILGTKAGETRGRRLEEIHAAALQPVPVPVD